MEKKRKINEEDILNILYGAKNKGFIIRAHYPFNKDITIYKNYDDREKCLSLIWNNTKFNGNFIIQPAEHVLSNNIEPNRDLIIQSAGHDGKILIKNEELSKEFLLKYDLFLEELTSYLENNLIKDINEMFAEEPKQQETINDLNDDDD